MKCYCNFNNASLSNSPRSEPMSDSEFNPDDIQLMQTNYNGYVLSNYDNEKL